MHEGDAQKDGTLMTGIQSNTDTLLVGIPMVICLFAGLFRLDELWTMPRTKPKPGRRLTNWDEKGVPICTDPVRTELTVYRRQG